MFSYVFFWLCQLYPQMLDRDQKELFLLIVSKGSGNGFLLICFIWMSVGMEGSRDCLAHGEPEWDTKSDWVGYWGSDEMWYNVSHAPLTHIHVVPTFNSLSWTSSTKWQRSNVWGSGGHVISLSSTPCLWNVFTGGVTMMTSHMVVSSLLAFL